MNSFGHRRRQRGGMMVLLGGIIIVLTGFAVLAADIGHIFIVRNELQNAADSSVLAGVNCLDKQDASGSSTDCIVAKSTSLNWDRTMEKAEAQIARNKSDGTALSSTDGGHVIEAGYWNLKDNIPSGGAFSRTFSPLTQFDKPALRVTVTRGAGMNGGPITMLTATMFGGSNVPMSASAVAVLSSPGNVIRGTVVPMVINKCMYEKFWDSSTGTPKIFNSSTDTDPAGLSKNGESWTLRIGSSYHYGTCESGQWTFFDSESTGASTIKALINGGNPGPVEIGDLVYVSPGTLSAGYIELEKRYPKLPVDVTVVVVDVPDLSKGDASKPSDRSAPVEAFAGFRITAIAKSGNPDDCPPPPRGEPKECKFIQGQFIPSLTTPGSSGIGPFYGTYTPPRLALIDNSD